MFKIFKKLNPRPAVIKPVHKNESFTYQINNIYSIYKFILSKEKNKNHRQVLFRFLYNIRHNLRNRRILSNMSSKKFILISTSDNNHWGAFNNLGHEIFFTRKIALILLSNNLIDNECVIVTANNDRKFLYNNIFNNVLTYDEFRTNRVLVDDVIDLCPYLSTTHPSTVKCLNKLGLCEEQLTSNQIFQNCNTETINSLCCNINFVDLNNTLFENVIKSVFFVIHIKTGTKYLNYIYNIIDTFGINSVIFTQLDGIPEKYLQTSNLQVYASLLNNSNCIFLITEWSGGGQLSQFCCKSNTLYYYDCYPHYYFNDQEQYYRESNDQNLFQHWDHYTPSKCKRIFLSKDEFENIHLLKTICLT
jgi:hypothetical protein